MTLEQQGRQPMQDGGICLVKGDKVIRGIAIVEALTKRREPRILPMRSLGLGNTTHHMHMGLKARC
jgi:hypothetical protein